MRKNGKLLSLTNGEGRINSKNDYMSLSDAERCSDYLRANDGKRPAEASLFLRNTCYSAITSQFDPVHSFCPQEEKLAYALQNPGRLALQLGKMLDEARKAAALAERSRIAHDVHDTLAQCLTGIYVQLEAASQVRHKNPDLADACIHKAKDLSHRGLQEVRRLVAALLPDADQYSDLAENLRELAQESSCDASTKVQFDCKRAVRLVPPDIGYQFFQIAREAVGNALRYAQAKIVVLKLGFTEVKVGLSIEDDGVGFRHENTTLSKGFGLNTMRQRADRIQARFSLQTSPGAGTSVQISAPCPAWSPSL
jgi:signal transduction histidine kinase